MTAVPDQPQPKGTVLRTIASIIKTQPHEPIFVFRRATLINAIKHFQTNLHAELHYAVKTNPESHVLSTLYAQGVDTFDVASLYEIEAVKKSVPNAKLYFMNPVKSFASINEAYFKHDVRHFAFDCMDEFQKISQATNNADDLCLYLRITIPNNFSELALSEKFGASLQEAPGILTAVRPQVKKLGVTFHVGSQCMHPDAYRIAMRMMKKILDKAKVDIEYFNVGGGFPSIYPGMMPPPLMDYFAAIHEEFDKIRKDRPNLILIAEPGRAISAECTSIIVRVELRKNNKLYINDGTYGCLFDAGGALNFIFPVQVVGRNKEQKCELQPFSMYGPTCDSIDYMKGPFYLPSDIEMGEYIEIGQVGAYGRTLSTGFNGFRQKRGVIEISDEPLMSMYGTKECLKQPLEVIAA